MMGASPTEGGWRVDSRPRALVTAPVRGPGLELLHELADLVIDPWIDQQPIRIYNAEQLAERAAAEGATILVVEADSCKGPVFELPLTAVASTRGDPTNVDVAGATAAGIRTGQTYRDGTIPYQRFRAWQLAGRTAGIVGLGAVGRALAWRLEGLGMRVVSSDPYAPDATHSLEQL